MKALIGLMFLSYLFVVFLTFTNVSDKIIGNMLFIPTGLFLFTGTIAMIKEIIK